jgi:hypothetical protein
METDTISQVIPESLDEALREYRANTYPCTITFDHLPGKEFRIDNSVMEWRDGELIGVRACDPHADRFVAVGLID